jgi:hypothetical protein
MANSNIECAHQHARSARRRAGCESEFRRYREFEVSPQGEWIDLDIDLDKPHHEDGWTWNSGLAVAVQIDRAAKIWYACMRIPTHLWTPGALKRETFCAPIFSGHKGLRRIASSYGGSQRISEAFTHPRCSAH